MDAPRPPDLAAVRRRIRSRGLAVAAALWAGLLATCAGPGATSRRADITPAPGAGAPLAGERHAFAVPEHGALEVTVPQGWRVRSITLEPDAPVSVRMDRPGGGALLLSPMWNPEGPDEADPIETARLFAELARRRALEDSAEAELPIRPLEQAEGAPVRGFWFVARDKNFVKPPPGTERWPNMLRGAAVVGSLLVTFSWFDDTPGPGRDEVLEVVRGARHVGGPGEVAGLAGGAAPAGPGPLQLTPAPEIVTQPLAVAAPDGAFTVLVDLPGFQMFQPRPTPDGLGLLVVGHHAADGLVASVRVGPGEGPADASACRSARLAALRRNAPDLTDLATSEVGPAARARYVLHDLQGEKIRQDHAHAFLARGGACIDVEVSKADPEPADAARIEAILASVRFADQL